MNTELKVSPAQARPSSTKWGQLSGVGSSSTRSADQRFLLLIQGTGVVEFERAADAQKAIEKFNSSLTLHEGAELDGFVLAVEEYDPSKHSGLQTAGRKRRPTVASGPKQYWKKKASGYRGRIGRDRD